MRPALRHLWLPLVATACVGCGGAPPRPTAGRPASIAIPAPPSPAPPEAPRPPVPRPDTLVAWGHVARPLDWAKLRGKATAKAGTPEQEPRPDAFQTWMQAADPGAAVDWAFVGAEPATACAFLPKDRDGFREWLRATFRVDDEGDRVRLSRRAPQPEPEGDPGAGASPGSETAAGPVVLCDLQGVSRGARAVCGDEEAVLLAARWLRNPPAPEDKSARAWLEVDIPKLAALNPKVHDVPLVGELGTVTAVVRLEGERATLTLDAPLTGLSSVIAHALIAAPAAAPASAPIVSAPHATSAAAYVEGPALPLALLDRFWDNLTKDALASERPAWEKLRRDVRAGVKGPIWLAYGVDQDVATGALAALKKATGRDREATQRRAESAFQGYLMLSTQTPAAQVVALGREYSRLAALKNGRAAGPGGPKTTETVRAPLVRGLPAGATVFEWVTSDARGRSAPAVVSRSVALVVPDGAGSLVVWADDEGQATQTARSTLAVPRAVAGGLTPTRGDPSAHAALAGRVTSRLGSFWMHTLSLHSPLNPSTALDDALAAPVEDIAFGVTAKADGTTLRLTAAGDLSGIGRVAETAVGPLMMVMLVAMMASHE